MNATAAAAAAAASAAATAGATQTQLPSPPSSPPHPIPVSHILPPTTVSGSSVGAGESDVVLTNVILRSEVGQPNPKEPGRNAPGPVVDTGVGNVPQVINDDDDDDGTQDSNEIDLSKPLSTWSFSQRGVSGQSHQVTSSGGVNGGPTAAVAAAVVVAGVSSVVGGSGGGPVSSTQHGSAGTAGGRKRKLVETEGTQDDTALSNALVMLKTQSKKKV